MRRYTQVVLGVALLGLVGACSSSNDSGDGNPVDGGGGGDNGPADGGMTEGEPTDDNSALGNIAGADASSQPVLIDTTALQASFDALQGTEPVSINEGDTVATLLEKAR